MKKSLIYTKTGDNGTTGLIGGTRVKKDHSRLEAYGTVDELNAHVGMIRSYPLENDTLQTLISIQRQLFSIGSYLATDASASDLRSRITMDESAIGHLENEMDRLESDLPPLHHFVIPGGHPSACQAHICRTVCRRAERRVITLATEMDVHDWVIRYLNRLSDYFFVLSRHLSHHFKSEEIRWLSGL